MNLSKLFADRMMRSIKSNKSTTKTVVKIATIGIALGITAMLLSVMIVTGFRDEISNKVTGFMSDLKIHQFDTNKSFEEVPCSIEQEFVKRLEKNNSIENIQPYAYKAGILKGKEDIEGIVLKGVNEQFNWDFFKDKIVEGRIPQINDTVNNEILISKNLAKRLKLKLNDKALVYFIQNDRKVRRLTICGIYNTGLSEEFDNIYIVCGLKLIQKVNNWPSNYIGGYEVNLKASADKEAIAQEIYQSIGYNFNVVTTKEQYPQIYNWLELQNLNVIVIISLITMVAGITILSTLLILVLENTKQLGILKALGMNDKLIVKSYSIIGQRILAQGMLWGNGIAITLCLLQDRFHFIGLSESSYYIDHIPVNLSLTGIVLVNVSTYLITMLILILPTKIIGQISPIKVLRFE